MFHAPLAAGGPETTLSGIWARRFDAATELAAHHSTVACATFEELLEVSDAIAFAVPPDVQAELAVRAAEAGKALLLDKPIALDVEAAERLADAVAAAGVGSIVVFTNRFATEVRDFIAASRLLDPVGAQLTMVTSAFLSGPFSASPWRHERGAVMDLGPHAIDLVTAALGPAGDITSRRSRNGWVSISIEHENGSDLQPLALRHGVRRPTATGHHLGSSRAGRVLVGRRDRRAAPSRHTPARVRRRRPQRGSARVRRPARPRNPALAGGGRRLKSTSAPCSCPPITPADADRGTPLSTPPVRISHQVGERDVRRRGCCRAAEGRADPRRSSPDRRTSRR